MKLSVQVFVQLPGKGGRRAILVGDTLHSGDHIVVEALVDGSAHVSMFSRKGDARTPLLPDPGGRLITPGVPLDVPLKLDDNVGAEMIQVIATAAPQPRDIPPISTDQSGRGDRVEAMSDAQGTANACFSFQHAAPAPSKLLR